ncbi:MAG: pyruvate ferredoxin oxidoreductase [Prevotella sp.]|nr:pyruvate ferredoxin oxidoreductase [Prevotella sp.]
MDYKYIEQLLERYFAAETSLEEESILRTFFHQEEIPAHLYQWRALFIADDEEILGDDFDARILEMTSEESQPVKAHEVKLSQRLMPLFKAAAIVAIILTLGGALQAPWDNNWNDPEDYAVLKQDVDTIMPVQPVQAENIGDIVITDSSQVLIPTQPKN